MKHRHGHEDAPRSYDPEEPRLTDEEFEAVNGWTSPTSPTPTNDPAPQLPAGDHHRDP